MFDVYKEETRFNKLSFIFLSIVPHFSPANIDPAQITNWLNISDPTMVPIPIAECEMKIETIFVKSPGAEDPAAINVAPATSSEKESLLAIILRAGINL